MKRVFGLSFIFLCLVSFRMAFAEYPEIQVLKRGDIIFTQLQNDIESYYKAAFRKATSAPPLAIFVYTRQKDETLFSMSARLNLPYETISTLNRLSQAREFFSCTRLLVPNTPGLFVPANPANALEEIMTSWRRQQASCGERVIVRLNGKDEAFFFYRGAKYHTIARAYFLKILFRFPLEHAVLTSDFGVRQDPFNGHPTFHNGLDLAAPVGTSVFSTREGTVAEVGYSDIYGNYVRISHPGGYDTLYGHLDQVFVRQNDPVKGGFPIGTVGLTGKTTGPHLHFEILKEGRAVNPGNLLPEK